MKIERVATGFLFTEGPMWHNGALWFSDLMGNRMYSLSADGTLKLLLDHAGGRDSFPAGAYGGSNAMVADRDGTVLMMQHSARRIVRVDEKLGVTPFLTAYDGQQFNSPNDLVFSPDGALYFTDPPFGLFNPATPNADLDKDPRRQIAFNGVYRYQGGTLTAGHHRSAATQWIGLLARRKNSLRGEQRKSLRATTAMTSSLTACSDRDNSSRT